MDTEIIPQVEDPNCRLLTTPLKKFQSQLGLNKIGLGFGDTKFL